jgi:hypothetical protein
MSEFARLRAKEPITAKTETGSAGPFTIVRTELAAAGVESLCWTEGCLVDWVAGGECYALDGRRAGRAINYAYCFDAAVVSSTGRFAVIYERLGTKGLVLRDGTLVREINRSYYHANVYEYPVALTSMPDGRELLIHCPDEYNVLEIDDADTNIRLTHSTERKPEDFFHSRLTVSPGNRYFFSAGWAWHPADDVLVFDVSAVLDDPRHLDSRDFVSVAASAEISAAAFLDDDRLLITCAATKDVYGLDDDSWEAADMPDASSASISLYDVVSKRLISTAQVSESIGTVMPLDEEYAIGFYKHPKLIHVPTGEIVARWEDVSTGRQLSSIIHGIDPLPPVALDPAGKRFAVATAEKIVVIELIQRQNAN